MNKQKIIIWDHSFHSKNKSTLFLTEELSKVFEVYHIWDDSWQNNKSPTTEEVNQINSQIIIFLQRIPNVEVVREIKCAKKIWMPMWDEFSQKPLGYEKFYTLGENVKIISFSKTLSKKINCNATFRYYPEPDKNFNLKNKNKSIFFWQRNSNINLELLTKIISKNDFEEIIYKPNPDPGQKLNSIDIEKVKEYNIKFIQPWLSHEQYLNYLKQCAVFFAPRVKEGIGMSFLEAMSHGLCVVSPDQATANEYITNNYNGILYDILNPKEIDLSCLNDLRLAAYESCVKGYADWRKSVPELINLIMQ